MNSVLSGWAGDGMMVMPRKRGHDTIPDEHGSATERGAIDANRGEMGG